MKFVGADLHKQSITFCVVQLDGRTTKVVERQRIFCREVNKIDQFLRSLGPYQVTVEASIGYDWFAALAEKHAERARGACRDCSCGQATHHCRKHP